MKKHRRFVENSESKSNNVSKDSKVLPGVAPCTVMLNPKEVRINKEFIIRDEDEVEPSLTDLVRSFKRSGVLQPIGVRRVGPNYELVFGYRRLLAALKAKLDKIPALVLEADDKEAMFKVLMENIHRKDPNPIVVAEYIKNLQSKFGLSAREIARETGVDVSYVTRRLKLLQLDPDVQECVYRGKLPFRLALELLKVKEPKHQAELANQYCMGQISRKEFLAKVNLASKLSERVMLREPVSIEQRTFTCFICGLQRPLNVRGGQILNNSICSTCAQWLLEEIIKIRREKGSTT
jgi:ParB/RepB/Spo0J family partition protein